MKGKGKGKVKMDMVENLSRRKAAYIRRKETLVKRMEEIATLCGVEAGLILYNEFEEGGGPVTWPASPERVQGVVQKFKSAGRMAEDVGSLVEARLGKEKVKLGRVKMENEGKETRQVLSECLGGKDMSGLSLVQLSALNWLVDENLSSLGERMRDLMGEDRVVNSGQR